MPRTKQSRNVGLARTLRQQMTLPEVLLWQRLAKSPDGVRFRRQHAVGRYVIDFYCAKTKIGIEVDGMVHDLGNHPVRDAERAAVLAEMGIDVMRIRAADALKSPDEVADAIVRYCKRG